MLNAWIIVIAVFIFMVLGVSQATAASTPRKIYGVNSIGPILIFVFISGITVLVLDVFRGDVRVILSRLHTSRAASMLKRRILRGEGNRRTIHSNTESPEIDPLNFQKGLYRPNLQAPAERLPTSLDADAYLFDDDDDKEF